MARAASALGDLEKAYSHAETGLHIIESSRAHLVHPNLRTSYFAAQQESYEFAIDLLMRLHMKNPTAGYSLKALEVHERAHARSLVEMLSESGRKFIVAYRKSLPIGNRCFGSGWPPASTGKMRSLTKDAWQPAALEKEIDRLSTSTNRSSPRSAPEVQAMLQSHNPPPVQPRKSNLSSTTIGQLFWNTP